jgi:hypothetical protein
MSKPLRHATLVILAAGLLVPAGLAAQDVVYTGCIKSGDGSLYNVRAGTTPMAACKAKDKQISWNMAGQPGPPGPVGPSLPPSLGIDVNCDEGQSIQAALAQQAERLSISIRGTCVEKVAIDRDDVALYGVGANPTIVAPAGEDSAVRILAAHRVYLAGLALTGGNWATVGADGGYFTAYQVKISNPTANGVAIVTGAGAHIAESEIAGCHASGISVDIGASLMLENSQVIDNEGVGVDVNGGMLRLWGSNVARNLYGVSATNGGVTMGAYGSTPCTVLDNRDQGVVLGTSHLYLDTCRIAGNGNSGIGLAGGSSAVISNVIVQANGSSMYVQGGSAVDVAGASTIDGGTELPGITLRDTSMANVSAESFITGSPYGIVCAPPPSVAQLTWPIPDTVTTNCPTGQ